MKPPASTATARSAPLASALMWIAIFAVPLLVVPSLHESFREPKLLAAEWLGLASLLALAPQLGGRRIDWRGFLRSPAVVAVVPLLALATASLATSRHPLHVREALWDLGVGTACLIGWTFGFGRAKKERFFVALLAPAALLAFLAILQFHRLWEPLRFAGIASDPRLGVTSLAGNRATSAPTSCCRSSPASGRCRPLRAGRASGSLSLSGSAFMPCSRPRRSRRSRRSPPASSSSGP